MKNYPALKTKKRSYSSLVTSASFLFENKKVSCIKKQEKEYLEKEVFHTESMFAVFDKEKILQKLKENKFFEQKYTFIDVSVLNDKFTLIPTEYFDEDTAEVFLNYNVPFFKNVGIRFNLVPQFDLVLVFYYPEELENIFTEFSDKIRITHTGFKFLSKIKSNPEKNGFFITTYDDCFEAALIENEKLLLYNIYPYKIAEDIVYFLRLIFKNTNRELSQTSMYYYGRLGRDGEILTMLSQHFKSANPGVEDSFERENYTILDVL
ncbi:MAG: DUF3822 family protein [Flavobacteriaceae bacterium]|jgi:hypothetical protein|nr:DUF3822 family protein [Flavobacteriaceae bacterium]